ncbi:hypothetical protein BZA05DRAFT_204567 [Tricharina praecox]|uniref:uncharacterized protein n=1 Tax=Tricharina praecox TaxID=43433 RepID=UPI002220EA98|nr:uncharacterized protein BZA05DRAFT_204567 [Tricharina praecox]KAI5856587.1 hypothetical protein BZA05DRAFT_204567 [Tricharina praecox]
MLGKLRTAHVRAVNSVGSGLEPIADESFVRRFRTLHHEIHSWCRNGFKQSSCAAPLTEVEPRILAQHLFWGRVHDIRLLRLSELIDCVAWAFMGKFIFSVWMPGCDVDILKCIKDLEALLEQGDSTLGNEKTAIWRSQTASLLFQNPRLKQTLEDVSSLSLELIAVLCSIPQHATLQEQLLPAIGGSLRSVRFLAAEMKCQRGSFRLDDSVGVGDLFDEETMQDVRSTEMEEGTQAIVAAVLSKGWIRIPPKEVDLVEQNICKTRVVISILSFVHS